MNPFKQIEKTKKVIGNLKYKYKYSKNKAKDGNDINTLIDTVNMFDSMLVSKYKTDAIDVLIVYIIKDWLLRYEVESKQSEINLKSIVDKIDLIFKYNSVSQINWLASSFVTYLSGHHVNKLEIDLSNAKEVSQEIKNIPSIEDFEILIVDLLKQIKTHVVWTKSI